MNAAVDTKSEQPLYLQLKEWIRTRVESGEWKPDAMIPSENELAALHDVSVGTVKRTLSLLVSEGILYRRQGRGTFVNRPDFTRSFIRFFRYDTKDGTETPSPTSRVIYAKIVPVPEIVQPHLRLQPADAVIAVRRVRLLNGEPFMWEDLFLAYETFAGFEKMDIENALLYPIYDKSFGVPIVWAEEYLEPRTADDRTASILGIRSADPVIYIERIAYSNWDAPVEFRMSTGRGDRFRYHIIIR